MKNKIFGVNMVFEQIYRPGKESVQVSRKKKVKLVMHVAMCISPLSRGNEEKVRLYSLRS